MTDIIEGGAITFSLPCAERPELTEQQLIDAGYIKLPKWQVIALLEKMSPNLCTNKELWHKVIPEEPK